MIGFAWNDGDLRKALMALAEPDRGDTVLQALTNAGEPMRARMAGNMKRSPDAPHAADHVVISPVTRVGDINGGRFERLGPGQHAVGIGPAKDHWYWLFQEYGTKFQRAQPAMRPAFDSTADATLRNLAGELWNLLRAKSARAGSTGGRGL